MEKTAAPPWFHVWALAYLQLLDGLTTAAAVKAGLLEGNPLVGALMRSNPAGGMIAAKLLAFALLAVCVWRRKWRAVRWAVRLYAFVCVWNLDSPRVGRREIAAARPRRHPNPSCAPRYAGAASGP